MATLGSASPRSAISRRERTEVRADHICKTSALSFRTRRSRICVNASADTPSATPDTPIMRHEKGLSLLPLEARQLSWFHLSGSSTSSTPAF